MTFAYPPPWWLVLVLAAGVLGLTVLEYRRPIVPLTIRRRAVLAGCRALILSLLLLFLFRPYVLTAPRTEAGAIVPVLVDASRSMRIADATGRRRLDEARALLKDLVPALGRTFRPQVFSLNDGISPADVDRLDVGGRGTDIGAALAVVRDRYRGQPIAGVVLLSDGADTGGRLSDSSLAGVPPVFAVGVGSTDALADREVVSLVAGDQKLDQTSVDLRVSLRSTRYGREPFSLRLLANGRLLEERRLSPAIEGAILEETFAVSPDPSIPTVYRAEIPARDGEAVPENNARSALVSPAGRKRRVLVLAGAPGFEHTFMLRALTRDPGLEVDAVVQKGRNADGQETYFIQAAQARTATLTGGFPRRREDLFVYDSLVIDNVDAGALSRDALAMATDFVAERGGGLLVVGGRSLSGRGLEGTPFESALPVQLSDRGGVSGRPALGAAGPMYKVVLTPDGEGHPATRIGSSLEETRRMWAALPTLAATGPVGVPRAGARVLAVAAGPADGVSSVIAVQQFGKGRSMTFSGEAFWRWRMLLPSTDRSYELIWRQAVRWLSMSSPDPFSVTVPDHVEPGEIAVVRVESRDAAFAPMGDAAVDARLTSPDGETSPLKLRRADAGSLTSEIAAGQEGLYRVGAEVRRGGATSGSAVRWMYVGGGDREFVEPRLNEPVLRRLARMSGGRYVRPAEARQIADWLREIARRDEPPERRDLWHEPWAFLLIAGTLSAEWIVRRRSGLR